MAKPINLDKLPVPIREEAFETTVRRWADVSARQLQDAYRVQRVYRNNYDKSHEVWRRNKKRTVLQFSKPDKNGKRRIIGKKEYSTWGWLDENMLREQKQKEHPQSEYWFSSGDSINKIGVDVIRLMQKPEEFLIRGDIQYRTTMQMYFAERGVGKNGPYHVRDGKDIKIMSQDPFSWRYRYVYGWDPGRGHSPRPNVRQQAYYMSRRLRWLAKEMFTFKLNTWMSATIASIADSAYISTPVGNITLSTEGKPFHYFKEPS